jgi:hypothetical protein
MCSLVFLAREAKVCLNGTHIYLQWEKFLHTFIEELAFLHSYIYVIWHVPKRICNSHANQFLSSKQVHLWWHCKKSKPKNKITPKIMFDPNIQETLSHKVLCRVHGETLFENQMFFWFNSNGNEGFFFVSLQLCGGIRACARQARF